MAQPDATKPEVLSAQMLDESDRMMADDRRSDETKRRVAYDLYPSLVLMARQVAT